MGTGSSPGSQSRGLKPGKKGGTPKGYKFKK
jgi:hypothetical protein